MFVLIGGSVVVENAVVGVMLEWNMKGSGVIAISVVAARRNASLYTLRDHFSLECSLFKCVPASVVDGPNIRS